MNIPDAAVGSIFAAMIAGLVVFVSTVLSKEQKTSEFRQVWIDELRKDVAQYVSGTIEFSALYTLKKKAQVGELDFLVENFDAIRELQSIEYRIIFRLNPLKHASLIGKIKGLRQSMISLYSQSLTSNTLEAVLTDAITDDCKLILKNEWERVKKGEKTFRFVKWASIGFAAAFGIFVILYFIFKTPARSSIDSGQIPHAAKTAEVPFLNPALCQEANQAVQVNVTSPVITAATNVPTYSAQKPSRSHVPKVTNNSSPSMRDPNLEKCPVSP
jgi:hypothetical protein